MLFQKRYLLVLVLTILGFSSCIQQLNNKNHIYFDGLEWYYGNELVFRNDSAITFTQFDSINQKFFNDSAFAIDYNDSCLTYTRYQKKGRFNDDKEFVPTHCEKVVDRVRYDFKYINNKPKLILYIEPFPLILSTKNDLQVPETHNLKSVKFIVSEYSIGDQIDRMLLKTRGIYNYPNYSIEDCELVDNKDITLKIIGYNTIYSIERRRIENFRVDEIVKVVSTKLNIEPEYRPMRQWVEGADYEYEFYRWVNNGVTVNLSRSKYVGSQSYRTLVGNDDWTLAYDDSFLQAILIETYRNGKPHSSIIN